MCVCVCVCVSVSVCVCVCVCVKMWDTGGLSSSLWIMANSLYDVHPSRRPLSVIDTRPEVNLTSSNPSLLMYTYSF